LEDGGKAVKRDVRLGRRNTEFFEVLEGLDPGDRVITSSYDNFGNNEVLILN
jgi:HlyD family secretion protein